MFIFQRMFWEDFWWRCFQVCWFTDAISGWNRERRKKADVNFRKLLRLIPAQQAKVPVVAGEEGICSGCGVATLSISYYDLGTATGKMAAKILKGESKIEEMPIEYAPEFTKKYN